MGSNQQLLYSKGIDKLQHGDILQSVVCWNELLRIDSNDYVALQNMALCQLKLGNYQEAIQLGEQVILHDPDNLELYKIRAEAAYFISDFSLAIQDAKQYLSKKLDDAWVWQILIDSLVFSGDSSQAREVNERALSYHPEHLVFMYLQAKLAIIDQDFRKASAKIKELLTIYDTEPDVHSLAADLYLKLDKKELCKKHFEKVIELDSERPNELNALGWIYFSEAQYVDANELFLKSVQLVREQVEAYLGSGHCYLKLDNTLQANKMFKQGSAYGEQDIRIWQLGLLIAHELDDKQLARKPIEMINKLDPSQLKNFR